MIVSRMDYHPLDSYIVFVAATAVAVAAVVVVVAAAAVEYACTAYVAASVPVAVAAVEATLFADFHVVAAENSCSHTNPASYYTSS